MLSEREEILALKAENKKLKNIVDYLDSKNKLYVEYLEKLNTSIATVEKKTPNFMDGGYINFIHGDYMFTTIETLQTPPMAIGYKGRKSVLTREIEEILEERD